ncbi:aminopeptidase P family protein [Opitutaceae bacterium TAV4]|nr:aminopeptidase P family protein [Opitutaceae bacterium TAV4]RRJ99257.1 aminopeptidase P family protein [Opitutaceae bacterium TAV3]
MAASGRFFERGWFSFHVFGFQNRICVSCVGLGNERSYKHNVNVAHFSRSSRSSQTESAPQPPPPVLLYADTERSADMLYFGGFHAPDPFIAVRVGGRKIAVLNALEFGRAKRASGFDVVLALEPLLNRARRVFALPKDKRPGPADVIALLAARYEVREFGVADDFPAGLADRLRERGVGVRPADVLFPEREIKTVVEAKAIREGNRASAIGIAAAERVLRAAKVRGGVLRYDGAVLTSERLRTAIEVACLEAGALSIGTIAAGGDQACDPHERGHGPLRAGELIVVDVFPRVMTSGYHGDMTRTFLKGRASEAQRALVAAVREAQAAALGAIRAGVNGRDVHGECIRVFKTRGFKTKRSAKGSVGFFHGTGHGLGLAVHEAPRVSTVDYTLKAGSVVTVEPGLYYPGAGLGGCRIEDVVQVTEGAPPLMLSDYHYEWELK